MSIKKDCTDNSVIISTTNALGNMLLGKILHQFLDFIYHTLSEGVGGLLTFALGVDADDGLGVRFAEVRPLVGKVDFYAVDVGDFLVLRLVIGFYAFENLVHVDFGRRCQF